jgi:hypothetical protein
MIFRNILLLVAAFFIVQTAFAGSVNAQQPTPTPTDRKKTDKDKKTDKSDAEKDDEPTEPRQRTQDGRIDAGSIPSISSSSDKRYRFEVGILPRFNSNLFEAEDDATKVSSFITTLSGKAEYDFVRNDKRTFTGSVQVRHNIYKDVENANSTDIDVTMHYKSDKNDFQATYFATPERLAFITGNNLYVHSNIQGGNFDYTRRLSKRFRASAAYQITRENYEGAAFDDRNNIRHRLIGEARYRVDYLFQPGIGFEYERVKADSENYNRSGYAPILLVVSSYKDIIYTSARYRFIRRDYATGNPLLANFDRRDYRHDFSLYSVVKIARQWHIYGFINALDNNSSRLGRSFTGYQSGLGLFFQFP